MGCFVATEFGSGDVTQPIINAPLSPLLLVHSELRDMPSFMGKPYIMWAASAINTEEPINSTLHNDTKARAFIGDTLTSRLNLPS